MKNLLHDIQIGVMLAWMAVGTSSCSDDWQELDQARVSFTATLPAESRAASFGDGSQVNTLVVGVFDKEEKTEITRKEFPVAGHTADVELALAKGQTYSFVFWAYKKDTQAVYDLTDLTAIKMKDLPESITFSEAEAMDAFFATLTDKEVTGSCSYPVELIRPLAQINVGTTVEPEPASFTVSKVPDTFHPFTNAVEGTKDFTWNFSNASDDKTFTINETDYYYLVLAYLFAPMNGTKINAELKVGNQEKSIPVDIQANLRTNIGVQ